MMETVRDDSNNEEIKQHQGTLVVNRKKKNYIPVSLNEKYRRSSVEAARLAEVDFIHNGARCRAPSGGFVGPRWVPDQEAQYCSRCEIPFDWYQRRHHCRHCGNIFCNNCSSVKAMLPSVFEERNPKRVCLKCANDLSPLQDSLIQTFANHTKMNFIDWSTGGLRRYLNLPFSNTLGSEIRKAAYSVTNILKSSMIKDNGFTLNLLRNARGLAFITVAKVGMVFAARMGTGLVVARLPNGEWSAPSAIATLGFSWGALVGADIVDYVIFLGHRTAVQAFSGIGQATIGAAMDLAIGPYGRAGSADINLGDIAAAATYTYSHSRGLYAGFSLDGAVIFSR
jgi:lipid-binding SYLF domain-containing protein